MGMYIRIQPVNNTKMYYQMQLYLISLSLLVPCWGQTIEYCSMVCNAPGFLQIVIFGFGFPPDKEEEMANVHCK